MRKIRPVVLVVVALACCTALGQGLTARMDALYESASRDHRGFVDAVRETVIDVVPVELRQQFLTTLEVKVGADNKGDLSSANVHKVAVIEAILRDVLPPEDVETIVAATVTAIEAQGEGEGEGEL